jgi:hypothetical protein
MLSEAVENRPDKEDPKRGGVRGWQIHGEY